MDTVVRTFVDSVLSIASFSCLVRMGDISGCWRRTARTVLDKRESVRLSINVSLKTPNGEDGVTILLDDAKSGFVKIPIWKLHSCHVIGFYITSEFDVEEFEEESEEEDEEVAEEEAKDQMKVADKAIVLKKGFDSKEWSFLLDVVGRDCRRYYIGDLDETFNSLNMASLNPIREDSGLKIENCAVDVNGPMFKWILRMLPWSEEKHLLNLAFSQPVDIEDKLIEACISVRNQHSMVKIWNCENMANLDVRFLKKLVEAFKNIKFTGEYFRLDVDVAIKEEDIEDLRSSILSHQIEDSPAIYKVHWFTIQVLDFELPKFENGIARCEFRFSFN
uniref:F-box domain-containing protein n=1 Tax=Steinernema glaseri TaxID=37863 RepID=A0A1I7YBX1_9BILA